MSILTKLNRYLLPGLAFKAVVIGGGYATGRELVEFFMPSGAMGGLYGMLVAMAIWSAVCMLTFLYAFRLQAFDYQSFFRSLLGRGDSIFEIVYFADLVLVLSVFGSAAGAIGTAILGVPLIVGTLALIAAVLVVAAWGQAAAEAVFKYVSILLYGVYAVFLILSFWKFTPEITQGFVAPSVIPAGWLSGGATYAAYNVIGAVLILPVLRHLRSGRDALISGFIAGPLAMAPAIIFFICLVPYYPSILGEALPSDYALRQLQQPLFHVLFQVMVFFALLECSVGFVQAFAARIDAFNERRGRVTTRFARVAIPAGITIGSVFVASSVGLVDLIAYGYRAMAYTVLLVFVLPLATIGLVRLFSKDRLDRRAVAAE